MLLRSYIIRIIEMLSLLGAIAIVIAAYYPTYMVDEDGNTVRVAERNIHSIVQAQKKYFAVNGKFFSIFSSEYSQLTEIERGWPNVLGIAVHVNMPLQLIVVFLL